MPRRWRWTNAPRRNRRIRFRCVWGNRPARRIGGWYACGLCAPSGFCADNSGAPRPKPSGLAVFQTHNAAQSSVPPRPDCWQNARPSCPRFPIKMRAIPAPVGAVVRVRAGGYPLVWKSYRAGAWRSSSCSYGFFGEWAIIRFYGVLWQTKNERWRLVNRPAGAGCF